MPDFNWMMFLAIAVGGSIAAAAYIGWLYFWFHYSDGEWWGMIVGIVLPSFLFAGILAGFLIQ